MIEYYPFTSESVSEGHPDKIADQISDAILDSILLQDKTAKVACEVFVKNGMVIVGGEITTKASIDIDQICRETIKDIGYDNVELGFTWNTCGILTCINKQSPDIALGMKQLSNNDQGAGDQGIMFGYATNETDVLMPAPIVYAHRLVKRQSELRKSGKIPWLGPDAKSQVTISYRNGKPHHIDAVVLSTQHSSNIDQTTLQEVVYSEIIKAVLPMKWLTNESQIYINPTGRFVLGGPVADCGLTGRKIIVDSYGGMARHGGGCFSGKDPSKVDRSAAYAARYVAKNIVAAGLAERCEIQMSYVIGVSKPISLNIQTFGTHKILESKILKLIDKHFDLRPGAIIERLNLLQPIYLQTASYGHFGRHDIYLPWEITDKANDLREDAFLNSKIQSILKTKVAV